ncbi:MAG: hypothetical protein KBT10_06725 [Bacteroidales bacterium]|nr:hypothetical protein [Candidatus Sodaliphilus aphodohippi]
MHKLLYIILCAIVSLGCLAEPTKPAGNKPDTINKEVQDTAKAQPKPKPKPTRPVVTSGFDGIDVSRYQKDIDWDELAKDKRVQYVYVKATEGTSFIDRCYERNISEAHRVGIKVGSYHFLRTNSPIREQFEHFISVANKEDQNLLPLLDVEVHQGWSNQQLRDSVKLFVDLLEDYYGCKPMIYTSSSFFNNRLGLGFAQYPLFIARYAANEPVLTNNTKWILWQFSDRGKVTGIDHYTDVSKFNHGCSLRNLIIKNNKLKSRTKPNSEIIDKTKQKPGKLNVTTAKPAKPAPAMSKAQQKELEKKQEKERKTQERAKQLELDRQHEIAKQKAKEQQHQRELQERAKQEKAKKAEAERKDEEAKKAKIAKQEAEKKAKQQEAARKAEETKKAKQEAEQKAKKQETARKTEQSKKTASTAQSATPVKKQAKTEAKTEAKSEAKTNTKTAAQTKATAKPKTTTTKQEKKEKLQQQRTNAGKQSKPIVPNARKTNKSSADND